MEDRFDLERFVDAQAGSYEQALAELRSSMTLFARADPAEALFADVLARWYGGRPDDATERILG